LAFTLDLSLRSFLCLFACTGQGQALARSDRSSAFSTSPEITHRLTRDHTDGKDLEKLWIYESGRQWGLLFSYISCSKVHVKQIFYQFIRKSFQNNEKWRLFYRHSTLGCLVTQDFDLCKLDYYSTMWTHGDVKYGIAVQKSKGSKYCRVDVLQELHIVKVVTWCHHGNILVNRPLSSWNEKCLNFCAQV